MYIYFFNQKTGTLLGRLDLYKGISQTGKSPCAGALTNLRWTVFSTAVYSSAGYFGTVTILVSLCCFFISNSNTTK